MRLLYLTLILTLIFAQNLRADAFLSKGLKVAKNESVKQSKRRLASASFPQSIMNYRKVFIQAAASSTAAVTGKTVAATAKADLVAKILGYCMGMGSLLLYSPILVRLLKEKNADGFSVSTWVYNVIGLVCAFAYPFKKGFPLSTYVEMIIISIQSACILCLICSYKNLMKEYITGMSLFCLGAGVILSPAVTLSPQVLSSLQFIAIIICNYATVPQILLTFKTKSASWSPITALMSIIGNSVRIFTTVQLTGDVITLTGNTMGLVGNIILLSQVYSYKTR